jgi:hypothetical protein
MSRDTRDIPEVALSLGFWQSSGSMEEERGRGCVCPARLLLLLGADQLSALLLARLSQVLSTRFRVVSVTFYKLVSR